jgi:hypothetical protein
MSNAFRPRRVGAGTLLQSGIPKRRPSANPASAYGVLLKGVVTATYVVDHENHPFAETAGAEPAAIYCDVLTYGRRWLFFRNCLVSQDRGAMHNGRIWKPRATSMTVTGDAVDLDKGTNPAGMDGDHVLLGFIDGNFNQPIILCGLPHPAADVGNEEKTEGHRLKLKLDDGDPDFWKHHGSYFGINNDGNFIVDTTFANDGTLQDDGKEQDPPTDGKGSQFCELPNAATRAITFYDMSDPANPEPKFMLTMDGPDAAFKWELEFVDDGTLITYFPDKTIIDIKGSNQLIIKEDKIEMGADGAGDKAVLDSKLQTELSRIKDDLTSLKTTFDAHMHADTFIAPLIPIGASPCVPTPPTSPWSGPSSPGATNSELVTIDS